MTVGERWLDGSEQGREITRELENLWTTGTLTGASDAQLLQRFTLDRDGPPNWPFRELLERHAPMVMGVCRQIVRRSQDVDDAFQATFLVLVRKARSIEVRESLGPWLYKVAYRTAQRARSRLRGTRRDGAGRRRSGGVVRRRGGRDFETAPHAPRRDRPACPKNTGRRSCFATLKARSHEEAARVLNWPVGTVSGRLSRGRALLKGRLERRGLAVPLAAVSRPFLNLSDPPPLSLIASTVKSALLAGASHLVAPNVLSLTQGVLRTMFFHKIKIRVGWRLSGLGSVSGVAGAIALRAAQERATRPERVDRRDAAAEQCRAKPARPHLDNPALEQRVEMPPVLATPFVGKNLPNLATIPVFGMGRSCS